MNIYNKSYTYLIGWSNQNKYYYGVRYANKTNPDDDLWNSYFTSSKYVAEHRKLHGEPDIIQIRKRFDDAESAIEWETKVLTRLKISKRNDFLNKNIGGAVIFTDEIRQKLVEYATGKRTTAEISAKKSESMKRFHKLNPGVLGHKGDRNGKNNPMYGRRHSDEARARMSESAKRRHKKTLPKEG
jgi:hypothetical protein